MTSSSIKSAGDELPVAAGAFHAISLPALDLSLSTLKCRNAARMRHDDCKVFIHDLADLICSHEKCTGFWRKHVS